MLKRRWISCNFHTTGPNFTFVCSIIALQRLVWPQFIKEHFFKASSFPVPIHFMKKVCKVMLHFWWGEMNIWKVMHFSLPYPLEITKIAKSRICIETTSINGRPRTNQFRFELKFVRQNKSCFTLRLKLLKSRFSNSKFHNSVLFLRSKIWTYIPCNLCPKTAVNWQLS